MAPARATARQRSSPLSEDPQTTRYKRAAADAGAELIEDGMRVGLGTGSTVAQLLPAIAARALHGVRYAATSPATELAAQALGLKIEPLDELGELDLAIDGADQIDTEAGSSRAAAAPTRARRSSPAPLAVLS